MLFLVKKVAKILGNVSSFFILRLYRRRILQGPDGYQDLAKIFHFFSWGYCIIQIFDLSLYSKGTRYGNKESRKD